MGIVSRNALTTNQSSVNGDDINDIYSDMFTEFNGSIDNNNIKASAGIVYSKLSLGGSIKNSDISSSADIGFDKLATLTDGNIIVGNGSDQAASVAMSGEATIDNTGAVSLNITDQADGDLMQYDGSGWVRIAKGTAGQVLTSDGTDSSWAGTLKGIKDYGTSGSTGTAKSAKDVYMYYGTLAVGGSSNATVTNLPFASATSYVVTFGVDLGSGSALEQTINRNSGAQFTVYNASGTARNVMWTAVGT